MSTSNEPSKNINISGKGKTVEEIMKKHISNKDDVISDEDFKNLDIESGTAKDPGETMIVPKTGELPENEEADKKITTPWDVIKD